jgi:F-box and leucine-rich repeat protein GRR1
MVSDFRRFLNTAPQFEELRNSLQPVADRLRTTRLRRPVVAPNAVQPEGEAFDEDLADDDNDFEGLDANEMVVEVHTAPPITAEEFNENMVIALPPPPPPLPPPPPPHAQLDHAGVAGSGSGDPVNEDQPRPQAFSSFLNSQQAVGSPPLSAYGSTQASVANVRSQREGESSSRNITPTGGASTALMHGQPPAQNRAEDEDMAAD